MYLDLIGSGPIRKSVHIWKIEVPLRIKIFMWFVHKEVILTKDNLVKRRWVGSSRCCFCDHDETIRHLFLDCPLTKILRRTIHIAFNVSPPISISTLFGTWPTEFKYRGIYSNRNMHNTLCYIELKILSFFAGYLQSHCLYPYVAITHS